MICDCSSQDSCSNQGFFPVAKAKLNSAMADLRGQIDGWVFKRYGNKLVVTRRPRMENVIWSRAQLAHWDKVRASGAFYQSVLADPILKRRYEAIAAKKGIPLSAVTLVEFMRRLKQGGSGSNARRLGKGRK